MQPRPPADAAPPPAELDPLARRALKNIAREYPNHPQIYAESDADIRPPRVVHPVFHGCFDWHSAVHSHWLLVRAFNLLPESALRAEIGAALTRAFEPAKVAVETAYLNRYRGFERPYGLAWLLTLAAEVENAHVPAWASAIEPLAAAAAANLTLGFERLRHPIRSGTHNQTAFALTLILDAVPDTALGIAARDKALHWYRDDADAPLRTEPGGEDFLSPSLMETDVMRRLLPAAEFTAWLGRFLPGIPPRDSADWLRPAEVSDETDGRAMHLHGLNLSRAWNLANIAAALPQTDRRRAALEGAAERHRRAGIEATLATTHYAGDHWLPTFAVYLLTNRAAR